MISKYPFHYEVRVKLLAFDKDNNTRNESFVKIFDEKNPLENRANAFKEFNEYVGFIEQVGRLRKDKYGNFWITQPSFVSEILSKRVDTEDYFEFKNVFDQYKEEISIYLVVEDNDVAKHVIDALEFQGKVENEFEIHKISSSSYDFEPQDLVDNLEMHEIPLYEHYQINVEDLKITVYHYGVDYAESGEDEDGAKRIILQTPFVWDSIDKYKDIVILNQDLEEDKPDESIDLLQIIKRGESNQVEFKPCLLYNFKTQTAGISVKYIIAKAICGFFNSNGGVLIVGVNDNGSIQGLQRYDYSLFQGKNEKDKLLLELDSLLAYFFDLSIKPLINSTIERIGGEDILVISVSESYKPIFLKNKRYGQIEKEFYIRMNASTRQIIDNEEMVEYVFNKQWR